MENLNTIVVKYWCPLILKSCNSVNALLFVAVLGIMHEYFFIK